MKLWECMSDGQHVRVPFLMVCRSRASKECHFRFLRRGPSEPGTPARLKERGHSADPGGPQYLIQLYEEDPPFRPVWRWFHGLIADRTRGTATLFNDRFGITGLLPRIQGCVLFAAEAKAILAVCPELRRINPQGLGEWIECGCVLENRTLLENGTSSSLRPLGCFATVPWTGKLVIFDPREWEEQVSTA